MEFTGLANYGLFFLTFVGIYAILSLGLNIQWGLAGQFNIGIAGFFAIGGYASAIITTAPSMAHLGGFGLPVPVGLVAAILCSGLVAVVIGLITVRLRTDYLAIATIGIAETIRLVLKNEEWLTNGVRGMPGIPRPLEGVFGHNPLVMLGSVLIAVAVVYWALERARVSPWGRVMRAIRENEAAAAASGKNVSRFRLEAFVLGSMIMGLAGGLYAHFFGFIGPEAYTPEFATFLVWVMLIAGGSGNNRGAIAGAFGIWLVWTGTEMLTGMLPVQFVTQAGALRLLLIGILIQVVLVYRPHGMIPDLDQSSR
ncbi:MAG: branched-chain amino acid ABC transporter permease [Rhodospirillales bacterium]|jgi:branched-chain amino acid transport system permease protein|nr:branched-chain amino acid ABC transporter permease [Rhodospirillaceae bacterium]MDP6427978.1 branched-chain amino acid ABC transporter permease [Rhodospirillales bacterium]MDP6646014.1 branched-chain amino acid ABC transporter permease [Rhodospirillales bacterium]MDP6841199.1 branched-chain amino acid ABC transporter permease [Rhodospirillales bacterium]|tara:strand:- start:1895 stop:2827 length:933 start_codon:yes stop_codon:yes gene_type:complete